MSGNNSSEVNNFIDKTAHRTIIDIDITVLPSELICDEVIDYVKAFSAELEQFVSDKKNESPKNVRVDFNVNVINRCADCTDCKYSEKKDKK